MDDETLKSLEAAYANTPENIDLLAVILQTRLERGEIDKARSMLRPLDPSRFEKQAHRLLAARIYMRA